jgi:hypothetical protein
MSANPALRSTSRLKIAQSPRGLARSAGIGAVIFLSLNMARAAFHLWSVDEVYSSADGSVQFIELSTASNLENSLFGHVISCTGPQGTHSFTFPANLSSSSTAGKTFLIGTTNLALVPGGVAPDYVLTNSMPFLFSGGGTITVGISGSFMPAASYTSLPTDGDSSLNGSASSLVAAVNSPKNFNNQSNTIVPVKFVSEAKVDTNFVMTFRTATGVNGSAGPNYTVEYKNLLSDSSWTPLSAVSGDGTTKSVSNSIASSPQRFFRLRAP